MILHLDMDAFFASVEQQDHPELRGKPVIISGRSMRAVVSTASYEARVFGVRSAMPLFQAVKLCPQATVIQGRMGRYKDVSQSIFNILQDFSPQVEPVSIDEAYLDIRGCERIMGSPLFMAQTIKDTIRQKEGLTCSIGISPLKFLSKIASDMNKPDGITIIGVDEVQGVIHDLPIRKVPGVGETTFKYLEQLGVRTLGDIKRVSAETLKNRIGVFGLRLKDLSQGIDSTCVIPLAERKSISTEQTLDKDTGNREQLKRMLLMQADDVARQLRQKKVKARTVSLKITFSNFKQHTRRHTVQTPIQSAREIYKEALALFEKEHLPLFLRLIGLGTSGLIPEDQPVQALLFADSDKNGTEKWEKAERAMDSILGKYGKNTVKRAVSKDFNVDPGD
ncbi:MAG: DNA polymerase IV [Proteobacteria bacterium]|nr:DNA polymerase IV [Pseudomonadota bacterium]